ncbi:MAG: type I DNA topoisomerase, partial [Bacteroidia bacterium]|nr:type I DNA topoisomerase [Bacteroidia bacterium]
MSKGKPLLIVESPTKARTIQRLLGDKYAVAASEGHVRDLPEKGMGISIQKTEEHYHFSPEYTLLPKKSDVIRRIQQEVSRAKQVYLATDEDREGEAIAWHLCKVLGLDAGTPLRITFHEITKRALEAALRSPRPINMHLVEAQQARRILDRIVGYSLSPLLWQTFVRRGKGTPVLSAGRVQSVALRLVVERERSILAFQPTFTIEGELLLEAQSEIYARLLKPAFSSLEEAQQVLQLLKEKHLRISDLRKKTRRRNPPAPFTTSSLQQEAYQRLGYSLSQTMRIAQNLYEKGHITYMRTDSLHIAPEALEAIHSVIREKFGAEFVSARVWEQKEKAVRAQEAHEAIRPTHPEVEEAGDTPQERKLYGLIWRRAVASQMPEALYEETTLTLEPEPSLPQSVLFEAKGVILVRPGYLLLYGKSEEEALSELPPVRVGETLAWRQLRLWEKYASPPSRYSEGALVKELEERGIGRPSTYAPTIETLIQRKYVQRAEARIPRPSYREVLLHPDGRIEMETHNPPPEIERKKLVPTPLGIQVTDFLVANFPDILDYDFTAKVEQELDLIAAESLDWQKMLSAFYVHFSDELLQARERRVSSRKIGEDPETGETVFLHWNAGGYYVARGTKDSPSYRTVGLPAHFVPDRLTPQEALFLLSLPKEVGAYEGKPVWLRLGPHGFYLHHEGKNYALPPHIMPMTLTSQQAAEVLAQKQEHVSASFRAPLLAFPEAQIEVR